MSLQPVKGPKRAEQSRLMAVKRTEDKGQRTFWFTNLSVFVCDCAFKKSNRLNRQNNNSARASLFFVHFFAVTARL